MLLIGIDVGGTYTKFGLIRDNQIIRKMSVATNTFDVVRQLINGAREIVQSEGLEIEDLQGIAIGFPGMIVDSIVKISPNIGIQNCNIKEVLESEFNKPVIVKNDADMAALAEHRFGAGKNCSNMILITLGTGVGGGIIINKQLYSGLGGAGELGHITIERNGKMCNCGRLGCAEQYVSMAALDVMARETMKNYPNTCIKKSIDGLIYASELMRAYNLNDTCAKEIVNKFVKELSSYVISLCNILRPEKIVIGGGVAYAPELIELVAYACKQANYGFENSPKVDIVKAELGNDAGMLGAAVCFEKVEEPQVEEDISEFVPLSQKLEERFNEESQAKENNINEDENQVSDNVSTNATEESNQVEDLFTNILNNENQEEVSDNSAELEDSEYTEDDLINSIGEMIDKEEAQEGNEAKDLQETSTDQGFSQQVQEINNSLEQNNYNESNSNIEERQEDSNMDFFARVTGMQSNNYKEEVMPQTNTIPQAEDTINETVESQIDQENVDQQEEFEYNQEAETENMVEPNINSFDTYDNVIEPESSINTSEEITSQNEVEEGNYEINSIVSDEEEIEMEEASYEYDQQEEAIVYSEQMLNKINSILNKKN